jgi:iron-sulfur cluster assembly accessory protein
MQQLFIPWPILPPENQLSILCAALQSETALETPMNLPPKVTSRAFARLAEIGAATQGQALRIAVEGGGCSGFQYEIALDAPKEDDLVLEGQGEKVVVDTVSLPFLENATIDFTEELIGARFTIDNPNATASCGCGTSFSM